MLVTYLDAPMTPPVRMPSPFGDPHPLAVHAAAVVRRELAAGLAREWRLADDGKMLGVLVVQTDEGRIGFLKAFSGMVNGRWLVDGWVPPVFDVAARDALWPAAERDLDELADRIAALDARMSPLRAAVDALAARHTSELGEMRARHRANREHRRAERARISSDHGARISSDHGARISSERGELHALDQLSRADAAERRRLDARHADERATAEAELQPLAQERQVLDRERAARSRELLQRMFATYALSNARGEVRTLEQVFAPASPPGGAGDCAAPKLFAYAFRHRLRPIAVAEFWVGAPPATGGRLDGQFYPPCRGKCGPILAHMLGGMDVDAAPHFGGDVIDEREPIAVFEDRWLAIVVKPVGLLSVPGKGGLVDSVLTRMRSRYPSATGPLIVHRLDLDTSGLLLVAKDAETYAALQRQFAERAIDKRYVAWLAGEVAGEGGVIELPLRVDLDDRPRQIVDERYGKEAITEWRVLERAAGRTKVALTPRTGRAHQLRVHAAHPRGIGAPIVGDRLYGRSDVRLMLHAETIAFVHPHTQVRLARHSVAPF